jgi:hypothetical protein
MLSTVAEIIPDLLIFVGVLAVLLIALIVGGLEAARHKSAETAINCSLL